MEGDRGKINFSELINILISAIQSFPDKRTGANCHFSLKDISLGAFSVFFTQSPSFLSFQTAMKEGRGNSNCQTLFSMNDIPSDNHIRDILDQVPAEKLYSVFDSVLTMLEDTGFLKKFRSFQNELLLVLDGTQYYSSKKIYCEHCLQKNREGTTTYHHDAIMSAIVSPDMKKAIALSPEFISIADGAKKQDCERNAAKRWLDRMGEKLSPLGITIMGDDLYANQPFLERVLDHDLNFITVCKPDSHKNLYEWIDVADYEKEVQTKQITIWTGKTNHHHLYRFTNGVQLRDTEDSLQVNWAEILIVDDNDKQVYKNSFITNHILTQDNIEDFIRAARSRWKIENENNNTLKTQGYHLEHNFGHGKNHLSETLACLNILAFLFHTILDLVDARYHLIRKTLPRRDRFFSDISALTTYFCFDNWEHLMKTMLQGLKLEDPG
jgi:hypothetical protein